MSGGILGFLRVNLAMDSAQFGAGAKSARRDLAAISTAAKATGAAVAAFGAAMGAMALRSASAATELQGMARTSNATMAEFQRAAFAAKTVGVENEKLADIFKDVNDRVGDFIATGAGPMADFFENIAPKVGVTADQFAKLSGPEALQLYVSSLEKAGVGQQEMIFYLEALASDTSTLLPLLANGGAEMKRLGDQASRFGLLNEDAAASGRNMREAMATLSAAVDAVGAALANSGLVDAMADIVRASADFIGLQVAPAIRSMAEAMSAALAETAPLGRALAVLGDNMDRIVTYAATAAAIFGGRLIASLALSAVRVLALVGGLKLLRFAIIRTGIGALIIGAGELVYQFTRLVEGAGGFGAAMGLLADVASEVWERIKTGAGAVVPAMKSLWADVEGAFLSAVQVMQEGWANFLHNMSAGLRDVPGMSDAFLAVKGAAIEAGSAFYETGVAIGEAATRAAAFSAEASEIVASSTAPLKSLDALSKAMEGAGEDAEGATESVERMNDAIGKIDIAGAAAGGGASGGKSGVVFPIRAEIEKTSDSVRDLAGDLSSTLGSGLSRAFDGLISGGMKFRDVLGSIVTDLAKMAANRLITQLLDQVIGAAIGGLSGGFTTPSGFSTSSNLGGTPLHFANGTQFAPGGLAMVGERGPELVTLPQGAQVTPNHQLGLGGQTTINVDARGATNPAAVEAAVRRAVPAISAAVARSTVTDMRRRGEV